MDNKYVFLFGGILIGLIVIPWLQRRGDEDDADGRILPDCSCQS